MASDSTRLNRFYVYELRDPRNGEVFYVGKGSGRRAWSHAYEWRKLGRINSRKLARINEIKLAGLDVEVGIVLDGLTEAVAYSEERRRIASLTDLTNLSTGQRSEIERVRDDADMLIDRALPPILWAKTFKKNRGRFPAPHEVDLYVFVVNRLKENRSRANQQFETGIQS